jgi:transposase
MLTLPVPVRIFVHTAPTDMRKSFDGLSTIVTDFMNEDPLSGHMFLFINRRRNLAKLLYWSGDGYALWYKRLERGTFEPPTAIRSTQDTSPRMEITASQMSLLLDGIELASARRRVRYARHK